MADYLTTDTELTSVADAIRAKGGTSASLTYPTGFVSAIQAIPTGGGTVNTCTMTVDADGVTCSDFSDHTPAGDYAVAVALYGTFSTFLFYANAGSGEAETLAIADTSNPGWMGYLTGPENTAILAGGEVFDTGGSIFYNYAGTYTGVVIEP